MNLVKNFNHEVESFLKAEKLPLRPITLVIASKYFSVEQILKLYNLGQRDFGENRVQDALLKIEILPKDIRWHFIGHLQKNKVNKVLDLFELIHSVDSYAIAEKISEKTSKKQKVLLQVNLSEESSKSGFSLENFPGELEKILLLKNIEVSGLMTMAKQTCDQEKVAHTFHSLRKLKDRYGKDSWHLSMGMSSDYQLALREGADILRIGRYFLAV